MKFFNTLNSFLILPLLLAFAIPYFPTLDYVEDVDKSAVPVELKKLPEFEVTLLDSGELLNSKNLRGKYVLIDVWSTRCGVCISEIPSLSKLNQRYADRNNFEILSIAINQKEKVESFREERYSMPWKHAVMEEGRDGTLYNLLQVERTPTYYLVSPEGDIIATRENFLEEGSFSGIIDQYL